MAANVQLKWNNGEKQRRAAQIPAKTWETHKPTIWELYKTKTLTELMDIMQVEHGFQATERQYTHRLGKWSKDIHDNGVISESTLGAILKQSDEILDNASDLRSENLKRPISRQSIGSRISQCSGDLRPPNKKLRATSNEYINDIDLPRTSDESFSDFNRSEVFEDSQSIVSSISSNGLAAAKSDSLESSDSHVKLPRSCSSEGCLCSIPYFQATCPCPQHRSFEPDVRPESHSTQLEGDLTALTEISTFPERPPLPEGPLPPQQVIEPTIRIFSRPVTLAFCLETSRKLQNFPNLSPDFVLSGETQDQLRIIADRLFAIDKFQAAGNIYSVLLKAEESELGRRIWLQDRTVLTPRLIGAARSAKTPQQRALVQDVLLKRLEWCRYQEQGLGWNSRRRVLDASTVSDAEYFLAHVFAAECFGRQEGHFTVSYHLNQAWSHFNKIRKEGDHALKTSMSILFYLCYKRVHLELPTSKVPGMTRFIGFAEAPISHDDLLNFCIQTRDQDPDEAQTRRREGNLMHQISTRVRDCVTWCGLTVNDEHLEMYRSSLSFDIFGYAWQVWQQHTILESPWMIDSENELGVSAAEHLRICIDILCSKGREELSDMSDEELLSLYLELFFERIPHTLGQQQTGLDEESNVSRASFAPTMASSLGSSNASLNMFKKVAEKSIFQSIKQRWTETPLRTARASSNRVSQMSEMSQLSSLFEVTSIREDDEAEPI